MFKNYLKIAFRNLLKNRSYTLINIAGLSLGLTSAFLIFALVRYHFGIDKHHKNAANIYRVTTNWVDANGNQDGSTTGVPYPFGQAMKNEYPEIEQLAMIEEQYNPMVLITENGQTKKFKKTGFDLDERGAFADANYFKIFDYQWIEGGPVSLNEPNHAVISRKYAEKFFGTTDCIGKVLKYDGRLNAKVDGVFEDYEDNTDFPFQIFISYSSLKEFFGGELNKDFGSINSSTQCFVSLNQKFTKAMWDKQMLGFIKKYKPDGVKDTRFTMSYLLDNHFNTDIGNVDKKLIYTLLLIALFLIITACINFVNLATAQAMKRSKEVGVRKVMGSTKAQLFWQFIFETALITIFSIIISVLLFLIAQPLIQNNLDGIFKFTFLYSPVLLFYLIGIVLFVILFSGAYPAMILSGFQPVVALKGKISTQQLGGINVRKGLVVTQFAISQMLIIGMAVVASQLTYFQNKDLGFKKEAVVTVQLPFTPEQDLVKMSTFKNKVQSLAGVDKFSYSMSGAPMTNWTSNTSIVFDNRPDSEEWGTNIKDIDAEYLDMYKIELVAGRNILPSDSAREYLVNETMVKKLGLKKPEDIINKTIDIRGKKLPVVGVIKDFHMRGLSSEIDPLTMTSKMSNVYFANIKLNTGNFKPTLEAINAAFDQVYPESFFNSSFVDVQVANTYKNELTMGKLVNFFAIVAILIGCLGLFGLVSFMANQKTKEIGIRKVLGASIGSILGLFGKEFSKLIVVAFIIAAPVAWWAMDKWLQDYQYSISIGWEIFAVSLASSVLIAVLTVGYKSTAAALMNPTKSLKTE
ncbi:ABC transporter permease [Lacihabitans sp. LS3-19]|uniref:ABC transporter permease n=1 Tax=Lacihabitans sp. LS3-19 TaxID=2487335 RepID=UPI0020CBDFD7|nr:ABC transporter permease [Lacihabitans sp. LS3-19]MCP9766513.1 ABC transporter permease [Lacihabitans sp. LS3-19]